MFKCFVWEGLKKHKPFFFLSQKKESINPLFLHCGVTDLMWQLFQNMEGIKYTMPKTTKELLECWNNTTGNIKQRQWWQTIPACVGWTVWKPGKKHKVLKEPTTHYKTLG